MTRIERPQSGEYAEFYASYINKAVAATTNDDLIGALQAAHRQTQELIGSLGDEQLNYRYAEGKWSVKELVGHLIDAERIFTYRALRIARGDQTPLAGFDENEYVPASNAANRPIADLLSEFAVVRASTIALFKSFTPAMLTNTGTASTKTISVRALMYITAGHEIHHVQVIRERYLGLAV